MSELVVKKKASFWPRYCVYALLLCFCLPLLTSCEGKRIIVNSIDEKDANEILVFLASRKVEAEKVKAEAAGGGGRTEVLWNVSVNAADAPEAMRLLNLQGLPRRPRQDLLGVFSTSGLVPSDLQEKIKYRAALAAELAGTIRKQEGVLDADVLVSFPEEDPLNPGKTKGKITAAVWVKHSGILDDPNSHTIFQIKRYVASAVTGLNPDDVTVIGERSRLGELPEGFQSAFEEEKSFVTIWSVIIARESITRFRVIFFSFTIGLMLLFLAFLWTLWKVYPLLSTRGGMRTLFTINQIAAEEVPQESSVEEGEGGDETPSKKEEKEEKDKGKGEKKDKDKEKGSIEKGVDET